MMEPSALSPAPVLAELDALEQFICLRDWRKLSDERRASLLRLHAVTVAHYQTLAGEFMALLSSGSTIPQAIAQLDAAFLHGLTVTGGTVRAAPFADLFEEALSLPPELHTRATRLQAFHTIRRRVPRSPRYRDRS
jgi:hypothetical protein